MDIAELLIAKGADLNAKDDWSQTPLHRAVEKNSKEAVIILISKGDLNAKEHMGQTALQFATTSKNLEIAELLKKAGAS